MNQAPLRIGLVGLDTSHAPAFAELLANPDNPHHVPGGQLVAAYPGGSDDFELSYSRIADYTDKIRSYGARIEDRIEAVAEACDAVLLTSVDGRVHPQQFERLARYGKPVFIDKPFAVSSRDAAQILRLAEEHGVPLMSCSSLRYAETFTEALSDADDGELTGIDSYGPLALQPTQPGLYWYGIHTTELLFAALGAACVEVTAVREESHELVVGRWADGRLGTLRGNRSGNNTFGALLHRTGGTRHVTIGGGKPYYASLLESIMTLFRQGKADVPLEQTAAIVRFIEAANESRETGKPVRL
ncbi:Gfo/Idh/MocA family oxidoreductase [Paenibacillus sp. IB182496]|uniref:Gfo/Idh/MocA family oxidoreductase n=1 Tax=Paenibacillus sabuli TaxID=2772509 RepID=A0A927BPB2_9BACL|nr:Gfo/Idh/MocA family oxidoreductase [Paenibacillus sabuli]MBD2844243.1 Gfo/Idh/MocA family oxidoreductase [Paenibacillus sabuli]